MACESVPQFFVPGVVDAITAQDLLSAVRHFVREEGWETELEPLFQLNYRHNGVPLVAEIGAQDPDTGEQVLFILESSAVYLVCTASRGVRRGTPILVGKADARTVQPFAGQAAS